METDRVFSVIEDVLHHHGNRSRVLDLDARRAEEAAMRRYEATSWLRELVGIVGAKDLPAEPSEEEFRLGLRSGIILCNALNKIESGAVQKVVESPCDSALIPEGAALSAYQYFENVRNFLVAVQERGIPTFEASDLEQGGKSSRIVNCVLALKSYSEWKQAGGNGVWKFGGNLKPTTSGKQLFRKNSEPFTNSLSKNRSAFENSVDGVCSEKEYNKTPCSSLSMLVRAILIDKKPEEIPNLVESVLSKIMEKLEHPIASQSESDKAGLRDSNTSYGMESQSKPSSSNVKIEEKNDEMLKKSGTSQKNNFVKQETIVDNQQKDIKALRQTLSTTKAGMQFMQVKFLEEFQSLGHHIHGLANAASGYHKVLEENRKLYNQVQDLKGSIRVYCRVRPFLPGQFSNSTTVDHIEEGTITINTLAKNGQAKKTFHFNKVFGPSATQEEVFSDTQPLVRSVLDGYNVCIFAFGQTGSGKTFTMSGPKDLTGVTQGVNYRALNDLFILAEQRKDTFCYDVRVQMIEIYNEQVRDLLINDGLSKRLEIRNSSQTGFSVPDASLIRVSSTSDVIDLMNIGQKNRAVGATALNDRSSRSHSCLTVHVQGRDITSGTTFRGCMHLVDLAGSERVDKSEVTGDRLKEAQHINKSLSALGDVISSLAQKNSHVPYRNSKLTQLLQDSLGGQAKTLMFVHISPEIDAVGETISTLKFAERVATVELGAARVNKDSTDVKELKEQVASLKAALARKDEEQKVSGSPCGLLSSPFQLNSNARNMGLRSPNSLRKPMEDVGNIELRGNHVTSQKRQSLELDDPIANSPIWPPPVTQNNLEDDTEMCSGEWVDKLMVNKQDHYPEKKPFGLLPANDQFGVDNSNDFNEINGIRHPSTPDVLSQFKHLSFSHGIGSKVQKSSEKQAKSPEFRTMIPKSAPSPPTRKKVTGSGVQGYPPQRSMGRHTAEVKRRK